MILENGSEFLRLLSADDVVEEVGRHHRPDGDKYIRGGTEGQRVVLDILVLTCTWGEQQREL